MKSISVICPCVFCKKEFGVEFRDKGAPLRYFKITEEIESTVYADEFTLQDDEREEFAPYFIDVSVPCSECGEENVLSIPKKYAMKVVGRKITRYAGVPQKKDSTI